jgi:hypothetical protein
MLRIEIGLCLLSVLLAFLWPTLGSRSFERLELGFARLSYRRGTAVAVAGLSALLLRMALLPIRPIPEPVVQDEFSYLLNADTFLHGRLTNPTHPMWVHFESFNIIHQPTYASIYPPAPGLFLALGRLMGGHPFAGVLLSVACLCAAICWMLQGWVSPPWALLGALLCVMRLSSFSYWANSYMVPAVAAIGGALVLGALPRIKQANRIRDALAMGIGLAILANSRPYEGLIYSIPIVIALIAWMFGRNAPPATILFPRIIAPLAVVLLITGLFILYYDWRVTGSPFVTPHQIGEKVYATIPKFLWQHSRPEPIYHHQIFRDYNRIVEVPFYSATRTRSGLLMMSILKMIVFWLFYLGPLFTLPILMALASLPPGFSCNHISKETRFLLTACTVSIAGFAVEMMFNVHYAAPVTGLVVLLVLLATRQLRSWQWRSRPIGLMLTRAVPIIAVVSLLVCAGAAPLRVSLNSNAWGRCWWSPWKAETGRAEIAQLLNDQPGEHLVLVRYKPAHDTIAEWVYNGADIDGSRTVWAREMDEESNQQLIDYFKDRQVWLLEPDQTPPKLSPWPQM